MSHDRIDSSLARQEIADWLGSMEGVRQATLSHIAGKYVVALLVDELSDDLDAELFANAKYRLSSFQGFCPELLVLGPKQRDSIFLRASGVETLVSKY